MQQPLTEERVRELIADNKLRFALIFPPDTLSTDAIGLRLARWVDRLGLNALATRLIDAGGGGDNRVYLLRKQAR